MWRAEWLLRVHITKSVGDHRYNSDYECIVRILGNGIFKDSDGGFGNRRCASVSTALVILSSSDHHVSRAWRFVAYTLMEIYFIYI